MAEISDRIFIDNVRGRLVDINRLGQDLQSVEPGRFAVIVLDAFYRFMPGGSDENDNAGMATIYNALDAAANRLRCCFVLIHHSSKGNQAGKSVTDIGAGAGAQSRAADTHLVLRPHEEDGAVVLDAAVRSWPPVHPVCLRWDFPVWIVDEHIDPAALEGRMKPKAKAEAKEPEREWSAFEFVESFVDDEPATKDEIWKRAKGEQGLSRDRVRALVAEALQLNLIELVSKGGSGRGGGRGYVRVRKELFDDNLI